MQDFLVLWLLCQLPSATENIATNFMQPIFILYKYMFLRCNSMSNHVRITFNHGLDISHAFWLHKGLPVM